ncbi:MAG: sigma-70 family RNA polymerase sigma factor, partial [Candidatus Portnoybacteria bacterium]|nr:sigma-70 family RNA polymerase sigma factor [Candidatus Portnoybacteria bacterium]
LLSTCLIEILGNVIRGAFKPTGDANIETYYKGIIKKEVANFFKAKSKENKRIIPIQDPDFNDDQEEVIAQKPLVAKRDIYEDSIRQEKLEKLSKAINKLPSRQRKALNFSLKEIRQEEIAKKMGITQAGANKLLTKARTNLYNLLLVPRGL